jgi:hypothetical protein
MPLLMRIAAPKAPVLIGGESFVSQRFGNQNGELGRGINGHVTYIGCGRGFRWLRLRENRLFESDLRNLDCIPTPPGCLGNRPF